MKPSHVRAGLIALLFVAGCGNHSPVIDVLGSYFPAWIVCIIAGLTLTLIARLLLIAFKLDTGLHPAGIVYPCLMIVFTMAVWLLFYKN